MRQHRVRWGDLQAGHGAWPVCENGAALWQGENGRQDSGNGSDGRDQRYLQRHRGYVHGGIQFRNHDQSTYGCHVRRNSSGDAERHAYQQRGFPGTITGPGRFPCAARKTSPQPVSWLTAPERDRGIRAPGFPAPQKLRPKRNSLSGANVMQSVMQAVMQANDRQGKRSRLVAGLLTMLTAAVMFAGVVVPARAQTFNSLYSFQGVNDNEGSYPMGLVQGTDGNLYGVTLAGGNAGEISSGTFFKISTRGNLKILYSNANSISVAPLVLASNKDFYGVSKNSGANNLGTVFKMTPAGKLTTLYSFCSVVQNGICLDGAQPVFGLVQGSDGNLYGTTSIGGSDGVNSGYGTIFKITQAGVLTTLYSFPGFTPSSSELVQGADGNFYGTTSSGGSGTYGAGGTFFRVTPSGSVTTLYNFCTLNHCADGSQPSNLYLATDGNFYGIAWGSGANDQGTIFQFTPSGTLTTLHNFDGADGSGPNGGGTLMQATNGTFYGTMMEGGTGWPTCSFVCDGTIFSLDMGLGPFVKMVPTSGKVKTAVRILGTGLTGATSVTFNGTEATFTVASSSEITAKVPTGATSGVIKVVTPSGTLTSNVVFQVP